MMKVLQSIGVDWRDRRMISKLYMIQEAVVRMAGGESDSGIIGRGVVESKVPTPGGRVVCPGNHEGPTPLETSGHKTLMVTGTYHPPLTLPPGVGTLLSF